jgi:hypothetical protein
MPMAAEMAARWWLRVVGVEAAVGRAGGAVGRSGWRRGVDGAARARLAVEDAEGEVKGGGDGAGRLGGEERRVTRRGALDPALFVCCLSATVFRICPSDHHTYTIR